MLELFIWIIKAIVISFLVLVVLATLSEIKKR